MTGLRIKRRQHTRAVHAGARNVRRNRRGFALLAVLLIAMAGAVVALATAMMTMSNGLVQASEASKNSLNPSRPTKLAESVLKHNLTMAKDDNATAGRLKAALDIVEAKSEANLDAIRARGALSGRNSGRNVAIWEARASRDDRLEAARLAREKADDDQKVASALAVDGAGFRRVSVAGS